MATAIWAHLHFLAQNYCGTAAVRITDGLWTLEVYHLKIYLSE